MVKRSRVRYKPFRNYIRFVIVFFVLYIFQTQSYAQYEEASSGLQFSVPEISLLNIAPFSVSNIELNVESGNVGFENTGNEEAVAVDNQLWINYTSSLASGSSRKKITVQIINGELPRGLKISVLASPYQGNGLGDFGIPTKEKNLNKNPRTIIKKIGRCYTGKGEGQGHNISYKLYIPNYDKLDNDGEITIYVAYTISDI